MGWAIALTASTFFSVATPVSRGALTAGIGATELLVARMALATLFMGLTIGIMNPRLLRTDKRCFWISIGCGTLNGTGMLIYVWGLERLTASMTAMLIARSGQPDLLSMLMPLIEDQSPHVALAACQAAFAIANPDFRERMLSALYPEVWDGQVFARKTAD